MLLLFYGVLDACIFSSIAAESWEVQVLNTLPFDLETTGRQTKGGTPSLSL
jgi:hypothetical protein